MFGQSKPYCVAVDVGRSAVKVVYDNPAGTCLCLAFPSIFSMAESVQSQQQGIKETGDVREVTINGKYWLMGETARKRGDYIIEATEGETLKDVSVAATLYSVAEALYRRKEGRSNVYLAINLTYDNFYMKDDYRKALVGKHAVQFNPGPVVAESDLIEFEIKKCFILYLGYTSMLATAMDAKTFAVKPLYGEGVGLVVDIGRRTVDVSFIDSLMVKEGKSFDFGTMKVFERVSSELRDRYKVVKHLYEIEEYFLKNKPVSTLKGEILKMDGFVEVAAEKVYPQLEVILKGFFESRTPDYLLLTGGGANMFSKKMKVQFPMTEVVYDPYYGNVYGLYRFLHRVVAETT